MSNREDYVRRTKVFVEKLNALAQKWGEEVPHRAAVHVPGGLLIIKRHKNAWGFFWNNSNDLNPAVPLDSAPLVSRMMAIEHLEDLKEAMYRSRERRMLDLDDAIVQLDELLAK